MRVPTLNGGILHFGKPQTHRGTLQMSIGTQSCQEPGLATVTPNTMPHCARPVSASTRNSAYRPCLVLSKGCALKTSCPRKSPRIRNRRRQPAERPSRDRTTESDQAASRRGCSRRNRSRSALHGSGSGCRRWRASNNVSALLREHRDHWRSSSNGQTLLAAAVAINQRQK